MTMGRAIEGEREDANLYICFSFSSVYFGVYLFILPISIAHVKSHFLVVTLLVQPVCLSILYFYFCILGSCMF